MSTIVTKISQFFSYLWGKKTELREMDERDALLAKVVVDIHRKRSHSTFVTVSLFALFPIHPINRDNAIAATNERIKKLLQVKEILQATRVLNRDDLAVYLPSVSAIKVVEIDVDRYVAYEGNGRLAALQKVFDPLDQIELEVELYHFDDPAKIIRRIQRVRRLHNLDSYS